MAGAPVPVGGAAGNRIVITVVGVVLASLAVCVRAAQQNPPAKQSVWDGVYTDM